MVKTSESVIKANGVKSLCWDGECLVDWVAGGNRYYLDGQVEQASVAYRFAFDACQISPSGEFAVIYFRLGTKGLVLHQGKILREINRSFYYANAYEYPIALVRLESGQEVLVHCPEVYNRLEVEDLLTGERLTASGTRKPLDYFYSRLSANAAGSFLMSAGWHWQPVDHVCVYDLNKALMNPSYLDGNGLELDTWAMNSSACFQGNDRMIAAFWNDVDEDLLDDVPPELRNERRNQLLFGEVKVFNLEDPKLISSVVPEDMTGTIMPIGESRFIGFYKYPKLFDLKSGDILHTWPQIDTGLQQSGIIWGIDSLPPMAFDPLNSRFAVADEEKISIVQLEIDTESKAV